MKIEIRDADHAQLVALAEARGEPDVSQVAYLEFRNRRRSADTPKASKTSKWAEAARFHRGNLSLTGNSEEVNELILEFREEFAV